MNVYARVTTDGYLVAAASEDDYTGTERYWADYYTGDFHEDEIDTLCLSDVPADLAADLCEHGTTGQVFSDGYEAWQAALPYSEGGA